MEAFRRDVVSSVTLNCLFAMDFVPRAKPPPPSEMVARELPTVLSAVCTSQNLGLDVEAKLRGFATADPAELLNEVCAAVRDVEKARRDVVERGHDDMVFSVLTYSRKPPTATEDRIRRMTRQVADILQVRIPDEFYERVGETYDHLHGSIVRV